MPPEAYALVALFAGSSVVLGILAWILVRTIVPGARLRSGAVAAGGTVLPIAAAFLALYLVGHRFGVSLGPQVPLFGFQVALLGDLAIGFAAALLVAAVQGLAISATRRGRAA
jgi:hypothetical protein